MIGKTSHWQIVGTNMKPLCCKSTREHLAICICISIPICIWSWRGQYAQKVHCWFLCFMWSAASWNIMLIIFGSSRRWSGDICYADHILCESNYFQAGVPPAAVLPKTSWVFVNVLHQHLVQRLGKSFVHDVWICFYNGLEEMFCKHGAFKHWLNIGSRRSCVLFAVQARQGARGGSTGPEKKPTQVQKKATKAQK